MSISYSTDPATQLESSAVTPARAALSKRRLALALGAALFVLAIASAAEARPRGRGRGGGVRVVSVGAFAPFGFGWGFGPGFGLWGPWGGPWSRGFAGPVREGSLSPGMARAMDLGALDLNVKPRKSEVWVDGVYYGLARDFDGLPDFLWLDAGEHTLSIRAPGHEPFERTFEAPPGVVADLKVRLVESPFGSTD